MKIYTDTKTYTETAGGLTLVCDSKHIPKVPGNADFDEYLSRVAQGKAITNDYIAPDLTIERLRIERDKLLAASDKYLLEDYPLGDVSIIAVKNYRQALRDLTNIDLTGIKSFDEVKLPVNPVE